MKPRSSTGAVLVVLVVLGAAALGVGAWRAAQPRAEARLPGWSAPFEELTAAYGPKLHSQHDEETLVRAFFQDRAGGFFLDVGASHYQHDSTTYYLEQRLGWRGIAVDALEEFRADYERFRPNTLFHAFFVTNEAGAVRDFFKYTRDTRISSGSVDRLRSLPRVKDRYIEKVQVPSVTLNQLLAAEQVAKVDFVSIDIEGHEPEALEGFDIDAYRPDLLCVEIQPYTREWIDRYFAAHGYAVIEPYRKVDAVNLYFRRVE
jgi:FkbM family methyltransferase